MTKWRKEELERIEFILTQIQGHGIAHESSIDILLSQMKSLNEVEILNQLLNDVLDNYWYWARLRDFERDDVLKLGFSELDADIYCKIYDIEEDED